MKIKFDKVKAKPLSKESSKERSLECLHIATYQLLVVMAHHSERGEKFIIDVIICLRGGMKQCGVQTLT